MTISTLFDPNTKRDALEVLRSGGVAILPTDTLYGFSAAVSATEAVHRICNIKKTREKRFILLAGSTDMVERYVRSFGDLTRARLSRVWPAPLTAILKAGSACPSWVGDTVAFRVPDLTPLRRLIDELNEPIVSTSVNHTGSPPLQSVREIESEFGAVVDLIVAADLEGTRPGVASTIVDLTAGGAIVVRAGDYDWVAGGEKPSK